MVRTPLRTDSSSEMKISMFFAFHSDRRPDLRRSKRTFRNGQRTKFASRLPNSEAIWQPWQVVQTLTGDLKTFLLGFGDFPGITGKLTNYDSSWSMVWEQCLSSWHGSLWDLGISSTHSFLWLSWTQRKHTSAFLPYHTSCSMIVM